VKFQSLNGITVAPEIWWFRGLRRIADGGSFIELRAKVGTNHVAEIYRKTTSTKEMMTRHNFKELQVVTAIPTAGARFPPYFVCGHPLSLRGLDEDV